MRASRWSRSGKCESVLIHHSVPDNDQTKGDDGGEGEADESSKWYHWFSATGAAGPGIFGAVGAAVWAGLVGAKS